MTQDQIKDLIKLLESIQWSYNRITDGVGVPFYAACPVCLASKTLGHFDSCGLAEQLDLLYSMKEPD